jgi:hypothetical protein
MTTEHDVLRELEAALDVSPSPDFEARVRERVKRQSMGVSRWAWPAGVAVAATAVLAVMLVPGRHSSARPELARLEAPVHVAPAPEVGRPVGSSRRSVEARQTSSATRTPRTVAPVRSGVESPAVVVPAGQMAAIRRLMSDVAANRVVIGPERPAPPEALQISALGEADPIAFDTIRFTPLSADVSPDLWR